MNKLSRLQIGKITDETKPSPLFCKFGVETVYETIIVRQMWFIPILPPKTVWKTSFLSVFTFTDRMLWNNRSAFNQSEFMILNNGWPEVIEFKSNYDKVCHLRVHKRQGIVFKIMQVCQQNDVTDHFKLWGKCCCIFFTRLVN